MLRKQKKLLIIIPAYNEAKNISAVLDQLEQPEIADIADVLVMDDASLDNTRQIVQDRGHTVVTHIFNLGYGSGLQLGYKYAVKKGYQYVIQMDADGQHDVCNVAKLYEKLRMPDSEGCCPDIVLGSRFLEGSAPFPVGVMKKFAMWLFRTLIRVGTGRRIMDPTTGLQGLSRRAFQYYATYSRFDDRYPDANMILQMLLLGFRVEEIPAVMHMRTEGVSMHSGLKPLFYMFRMMFSMIAVWLRIKLYKVDVGVADDKKAA
ncbi:MAG: glycosyltransferase family 2 protein [Acetatifactor sp.]|nr:glycosyltransferase family 2 protein [Acetatifactor sp.]